MTRVFGAGSCPVSAASKGLLRRSGGVSRFLPYARPGFGILAGMSNSTVTILGAGLAGSEAALQLADRGVRVRLVEMRPVSSTPVHVSSDCAELVCSNSLKSTKPQSAAGMLKRELALLGSQGLCGSRAQRGSRWRRACGRSRRFFRRRDRADRGASFDRTGSGGSDRPCGVRAGSGRPGGRHGPAHLRCACPRTLLDSRAESIWRSTMPRPPIVMADSLDFGKLFRQSRYEDAEAGAGDYLNAPFSPRGVRGVHRRAGERGARHQARLRDARPVPGVPAYRGDRPQGRGRASVRNAQAGGVDRPPARAGGLGPPCSCGRKTRRA